MAQIDHDGVEFHVTIVRHGQTVANVDKIIQGHCDTPLTELGIAQTQALVKYFLLKNHKFNRVYSSDLGRASRTCEIITNSCSIGTAAKIHLDSRLRERAYGQLYEKRPIGLLQQEAYSHGYDSNNFTQYTPNGAESLDAFRQRVANFCDDCLWPNARNGDEILIVSHWATIKEFLKLFQPHSNGTIRTEHLLETANVAFSRFKIRKRNNSSGNISSSSSLTTTDTTTKHKFTLEITGLDLHQTPHLRKEQISINLRHQLV